VPEYRVLVAAQVAAENAELAKKNTRLIEESEAMIARMGANDTEPAQAASRRARRALFSFRRCEVSPHSGTTCQIVCLHSSPLFPVFFSLSSTFLL
jgi:hypothetical protein